MAVAVGVAVGVGAAVVGRREPRPRVCAVARPVRSAELAKADGSARLPQRHLVFGSAKVVAGRSGVARLPVARAPRPRQTLTPAEAAVARAASAETVVPRIDYLRDKAVGLLDSGVRPFAL